MLPHLRLVALAVLAAVALSACYSLVEPSFRPGNSRELFQAINRRVTASAPLAGKSACADPELIGNAVHLTAATDSDAEPRDVYVYTFRTRSWDDSKAAVDACQAEFEAANPDAEVTRIDVPIWRIFGADWSPELATRLEEALDEAHDAG